MHVKYISYYYKPLATNVTLFGTCKGPINRSLFSVYFVSRRRVVMFETTVTHTSKFSLKFGIKEPVYQWILAGVSRCQNDGDGELGRCNLFQVHCQETDDEERQPHKYKYTHDGDEHFGQPLLLFCAFVRSNTPGTHRRGFHDFEYFYVIKRNDNKR